MAKLNFTCDFVLVDVDVFSAAVIVCINIYAELPSLTLEVVLKKGVSSDRVDDKLVFFPFLSGVLDLVEGFRDDRLNFVKFAGELLSEDFLPVVD